ncbi:MAG: hypothetical protein JOZ08_21055 [Verrucomicrobia bacterium]|nr:hypothetical protein [Verrucomicrobiota bacterium]MBV8279800.1 hypothetical protein [Verrucomicrobiota bacterium]
MSRSKKQPPPPPRQEMIDAVAEAIREFEKLAADPEVVGACPELPGVVLDRIMGRCLDRKGEEYHTAIAAYDNIRQEYVQALVSHPIGRTLALLAVGPDGVKMMEAGRVPATQADISAPPERALHARKVNYNCHHMIPKSVAVAGGNDVVNHPRNFVIANTTRRGRDQSQNPHHFWHSLLLHPQTHNAPSGEIPIYVVRPLFPFYPPISQGFKTAEALREHLKNLGAPPLPEVWEKRILEFSKATGHRAYSVPKEFHEITRAFGEFYSPKNKEESANQAVRDALARKVETISAEWLPGDAYVNGRQLGADHVPKHKLPLADSGLTTIPETPLPAKTKSNRKRTQHKISAGPKVNAGATAKV